MITSACLLILSYCLLTNALTKTVIITGANSGIGLAAVKQLLKEDDCRIVLACRSEAKTLQVITNLPAEQRSRVELRQVDVSDLDSIRSFAKAWGSKPIDCLALNAGIQLTGTKAPQFSKQGYELTIATNHLGQFLLCQLLLPRVKKAKGRVVLTASGVHNPAEPGGDVGSKASLGGLEGLKGGFKAPICMLSAPDAPYDPDKAYKDSKLCNVMTMRELARRLEKERSGVTVNAFNPGLVPTTGLFRTLPPIAAGLFAFFTRVLLQVAVSEEEAGARLVYLIRAKELEGVTGQYYSGKPGKKEFSPYAISAEAGDEAKTRLLFSLSEQLVGRK